VLPPVVELDAHSACVTPGAKLRAGLSWLSHSHSRLTIDEDRLPWRVRPRRTAPWTLPGCEALAVRSFVPQRTAAAPQRSCLACRRSVLSRGSAPAAAGLWNAEVPRAGPRRSRRTSGLSRCRRSAARGRRVAGTAPGFPSVSSTGSSSMGRLATSSRQATFPERGRTWRRNRSIKPAPTLDGNARIAPPAQLDMCPRRTSRSTFS
jgi:hypothetical protein